jgi:muramoyltetrapeptide carboxypeptidase
MLAGNFGAETLNEFTEHHFWQALRNPAFTLEWHGEGRTVAPTARCGAAIWRC